MLKIGVGEFQDGDTNGWPDEKASTGAYLHDVCTSARAYTVDCTSGARAAGEPAATNAATAEKKEEGQLVQLH